MSRIGIDPEKFIEPSLRLRERAESLASSLELSSGELETLVILAEALWVTEETVGHHLYESYVAAILSERDPAQQSLKIARALMFRSSREAFGETFARLAQIPEYKDAPFYRLSPADRALLAVAHAQRWSYEKLTEVFECSRDTLEQRLWQARTQLMMNADSKALAYTQWLGGPKSGLHCPEYHTTQPWTQRFLDGEIVHARERAFLQNHLMVCQGCQKALHAARNLYYQVDQLIPRSRLAAVFARQLADISRKTLAMAIPGKMTFGESLRIFFARREVRWVLASMLVLMVLNRFV